MHISETFSSEDVIPQTVVLTFDGEARSGKGTSVTAVHDALQTEGRSVEVIDQGKKFRALAIAANQAGYGTDSLDRLTDFLRIDNAQILMQSILDEAADRKKAGDKNAYQELDSPEVGAQAGRVGKIDYSHRVAIDTLFTKVQSLVSGGTETVLVDGRCMDKYGRIMAERKIAQYGLGFYFRCEPSVAARRVEGLMRDVDVDDEADDKEKKKQMAEVLKLHRQTIAISKRNRSDTLRPIDPMRRPHGAFELDLSTFDVADNEMVEQMVLDCLMRETVSLDTAYTRTIAEMTVPVVAISKATVELHDLERQRFKENPKLWNSALLFGDSRREFIAGDDETLVVLTRP